MKKFFILATIVLVVPIIVFAAAKPYYTKAMTVNPGVIGGMGKKEYENANYEVKLEVKDIVNSSYPQKINIGLFKYNWLGNETLKKSLLGKNASKGTDGNGTMWIYELGKQGKGNTNVKFGAFEKAFTGSTSSGQLYAGFVSDNVTVKSYNE